MLRLLITLVVVYLVYMTMELLSYLEDIPDVGFILLAIIVYSLEPFVISSEMLGKDPAQKFVPLKTEEKKKD